MSAGCEVSVLEAAMHDLQAEMHNKRREAYDQEDRLGTENPLVFATVQVTFRWSKVSLDIYGALQYTPCWGAVCVVPLRSWAR